MFPRIAIGPFSIGAYFAINAVAFGLGLYLMAARAETRLPGRAREISNMTLAMFAAALVGFRFFHVFFELPDYYLANPAEVFKFWKGGYVAYGGLFMPIVVGFFWIRSARLPVYETVDILAPPFALIFVISRLACFAEGCCFGSPTECALGVIFPPGGAAPPGVPLHPTQLYLSLSALVVYLVLKLLETRWKSVYFPGLLGAVFLFVYPLARFVVEFFRADFRGPALAGLSVSQWLSLCLMALGVFIFLGARAAARRSKSPDFPLNSVAGSEKSE